MPRIRIIVRWELGRAVALLEDRPHIRGGGNSVSSAVGDLIINNPDVFGLQVTEVMRV